jgi:hypothetical protein
MVKMKFRLGDRKPKTGVFVALSFQPNPFIKMGGMDRCVAFYFMPGAKQQTYICCWLHQHPYYYLTRPFQCKL